MGASSVTGVGQGSADKTGQKGSEHLFVGVEKLIGPRVVLAGSWTLAGTSDEIVFPQPLPGVAADYIVITQSNAGTHSWASSFDVDGFTLNGTDTNVVAYAVIRVNNASVTAYPTHN